MPANLLDTVSGALHLSLLFFITLLLPAMLQLLLLFIAGWFLLRLAFRTSAPLGYLLGLIGVPVHEFSHAIGALVTLCGVAAVKPVIDELGYAFVSTKRSNFAGRIVMGLAPLFGGTLVLWLTARYIIPGFELPSVSTPHLSLESAASLNTVIRESLDYLSQMVQTAYSGFPSLKWTDWRTWAGLYIALSVGIGVAPSSQDLKVLLEGLPFAGLLAFGVFAWLYVSGHAESTLLALQEGLAVHLLRFSTALTYALVFTTLGVLVLFPLRLVQKILSG
jgi:hypothetical protein